ncbi:GNAT family N-acetyltransferase [Bermanella sp. R86510]|uniref:GNAT family N-acetyltransferase n=1 Tax=unclassified Bermanella TaxID=2627862 RepID=UPI0037C966E9
MRQMVRPLQHSDISALLSIQHVCFPTLPPESAQSFEMKLEASPNTCFAYEQNTELLGYLISIPWPMTAPPSLNLQTYRPPEPCDGLYLHDLSLLPEARGTGAGQALISQFMSALEQSDYEQASLIAVQGTAPYWEKVGFEVQQPNQVITEKLKTYGDDARYMLLNANLI